MLRARTLSPGRNRAGAGSGRLQSRFLVRFSLAWSGVSGASEAPKSTVLAVIAAIPAPEPVGEYETL